MRESTLKRILFALLLAAASCRAVGDDFSSARVADLRLGETTATEVREWFGEPYKRVEHKKATLASEIIYYRHASGDLEGARGRVLAVELADERVRAWLFDSSMEGDSTAFAGERRSELKTGLTTADEARAILGPPSGRIALPSNLVDQHLSDALPAGAVEVSIWRHTVIERELVFLDSETEILGLAFDAGGLLLHAEHRDTRD